MAAAAGRSRAEGMPHRMRSAVVALLLLAGLSAGCTPDPATRRIEIRIHYSHFDPSELTVPHDVAVTFVLINQDPIDHEWLIGDTAFHERHRQGREAHHGTRPDEVSIAALTTVATTLTFANPGTLQFICHFPGHEAYGMVGTLTIT
jgi:uncharacterized cupredoxin-like copper-binding protein